MRVVIATEPRELQHFLTDIVEEQPGAVVVGQAGNAVNALTAVDNLVPDVTIVDSNLPYSVGLDKVALSRVSGLDVAQSISEKRPKTRVILLTNLDERVLVNQNLNPHDSTFFLAREGTNIPFTLQELGPKSAPVFASIGARARVLPKPTLRRRVNRMSGDAIFLGGLAIIGGVLLIITWLLTPVGIVLASLGLAAVAFGLLTKLGSKIWH